MKFHFSLKEKTVQKTIKPKITIEADKELIQCIKNTTISNLNSQENLKTN